MDKLESKLKMMEIAFEQINNSRNDLIKQLADCEALNEELQEKIGKIEAYVLVLQEGDPENEDPKKILDFIDETLEK